MELITHLDHQLFLLLNGLHHDLLDAPMRFITGRFTWIPFYALLLGWLTWKFKRQAVGVVLVIALTIAAADQFSSSLMKPYFKRPRPCHETTLTGKVNLVVEGCGGQYGFVSSHASDSFALAMLLWLLCRRLPQGRLIGAGMFVWAALVSYSRVYVGVHYPGDIMAGALIGMLIGWMLYAMARKAGVVAFAGRG